MQNVDDLNVEKAVLCACLEVPELFVQLVPLLEPGDFADKRHRSLWKGLQALFEERERPDAVRIMEMVRKGEIECGEEYIQELRDYLPSIGEYSVKGAERWAEKVGERAQLRRVRNRLSDVLRASEDPDTPLDDVVSQVMETVVSQRSAEGDWFPLLSEGLESFDVLWEAWKAGRTDDKVPTGFTALDRALGGGLGKGKLTVVSGRPGTFKCLRHDQRVLDGRTGERVPIEQFVKERREWVLALDAANMSLKPMRVSDWVESGVQPCVEVRLATGRSVVCTPDHPFLTVPGWRKVRELHVGSFVATPRQLPVSTAYSAGDRAGLLGYLLADGHMTNSIGFTNGDPDLRADFERRVVGLFRDCKVTWEGFGGRTLTGRVHNRERHWGPDDSSVKVWLQRLGVFGCDAGEKFIPQEVFLWSRGSHRELLAAMFACDGAASSLPREVSYTSKSLRLIQDMRHLLLRFGIVSRTHPVGNVAWRLVVSGADQVGCFLRDVGFVGHKQPDSYSPGHGNPNVGIVPAEVWSLIDQAIRRNGVNVAQLERARLGGEPGKKFNPHRFTRGVGRERLSAYAEILDDARLRALARGDVFWDRIVAIEDVGTGRTYDLCVPGAQNFVAEDLIVHNTAWIWLVMKNVAESLNGDGHVAMASLEMDREDLIKRGACAEARVDSRLLTELSPEQQRRFERAKDYVAQLPIRVECRPMSTSKLNYALFRLMTREDVKLLVVDYVELLSDVGDSEGDRVVHIYKTLREIAKTHNIPVVALSQVNRETERTLSRIPGQENIRWGGEQIADTIVATYWPFGYIERGQPVQVPEGFGFEEYVDGESLSSRRKKDLANRSKFYLIVTKGRFSGSAVVPLDVVPEYTLITNRAESASGGVRLSGKDRASGESDF